MRGEPVEKEYPSASLHQTIPALLLLAAVFLLNFMGRLIFSPLLPEIEREMALTHGAAAAIFLFLTCGYFLSILLSGFVSLPLGHKRTIVTSSCCCGVMLLVIGLCDSLNGLRFGVFLLGGAAGLYLQSGLSTIHQLVSPGYLARAIGIHELAPNIGFVLTPLVCGAMLTFVSWRQSLQLLGFIIFFMGLIYGYWGTKTKRQDTRLTLFSLRRLLLLPRFWIMVALFALAICSALGVYAMLPLYLVTEHGMEQAAANRLVALSRISSVFMPLVAGWFGDKFGNEALMLSVLLFAGCTTIPLGLLTGKMLLIFIVLQPMVVVCFFPSGFAVLSGVGGKGERGMAVSICIPLAFLFGGGVMPACIGVVGDYATLGAGITVTGCITVLVAILAIWQARGNYSSTN